MYKLYLRVVWKERLVEGIQYIKHGNWMIKKILIYVCYTK